MIGLTVSRYRITEQLGEGGMGVVYKAEDTVLRRAVAIKFLLPSGDGKNFRERFLIEARALAELSQHQNIATIYDYGETDDGRPFIVMEWVEGRTLDSLLRAEARPTLRDVVEIVERVAEALAEAHQHDIVHRDIKPANIVVKAGGSVGVALGGVKVLDFGLAKLLPPASATGAATHDAPTIAANLTAENVVLGTPLYLSPEQAKGLAVDPRSDLFALGAVLYECMAGRPPFSGSLGEIFWQVINVNPPPPSAHNPAVPAEIDRIALKALAKSPSERYQTADEMLADLRSARAALTAAAAPRTVRLDRAAGTSRMSQALKTLERLRRPRYYVPAAAALALAVAASMWAMRAARVPPPHPKAVERFEEGTKALRDGTYFKAKKLLEDAVEIDGRFALAHARLAEAWMELDYSQRAMASMMTAQALAREHKGLPREEDEAYVDAIDATIRQDFPRAVRIYADIAARSPLEPRVHVDLGRARERNEEADGAIKSYQKAAELDPHYAAAYLRLGALLGRKQNLLAAEASFAQAKKIYETTDSYEGVAEIDYQRGSLADADGKLAEARALFQGAYDIADKTKNEYHRIKSLLGLSSIAAKEGKTAEARERAAQALDLARAAGIENLTAQGLINLGDAFTTRREYAEAEGYLRRAIELAQVSKGRRSEALASLALARMYVQQQQEQKTEEAFAHIERALAFFRRGGYGREVAQALLLRGRAKLHRGDLDGALYDFGEQLQIAKQVSGSAQLANSYHFTGQLLAERDLYAEALRHFDEGYAINSSLGNPLNAGYSLLGRADMLWRLGRADESRQALDQVPELAERLDSKYRQVLIIRRHLVNARLALSQRRLPEAVAEGEQAVALAGEEAKYARIEAKYALGLAQALAGAIRPGEKNCAEAVELAAREYDASLSPNALAALAEARLAGGDAAGALASALKAQEHFSRAGRWESEWRARLVTGRVYQQLDEAQSAREQFARAEELLSLLQQKWEQGVFDRYANRPDVQLYRRQLGEALAAAK